MELCFKFKVVLLFPKVNRFSSAAVGWILMCDLTTLQRQKTNLTSPENVSALSHSVLVDELQFVKINVCINFLSMICNSGRLCIIMKFA